jgi:hypothetical protein
MNNATHAGHLAALQIFTPASYLRTHSIRIRSRRQLIITAVLCDPACLLYKGKAVPQHARCGPEGSRRFRLPDFMTFGTWRRWGQPHAPAAFTLFLVLIFTRGWVDPRAMVRSEGNMSLKNPMTPPGIDPGTLRLVAQRFKDYATPLQLFYPGSKYRIHNSRIWSYLLGNIKKVWKQKWFSSVKSCRRLISNQVQEIKCRYTEYIRKQTLKQHSILKHLEWAWWQLLKR